MSLLTNFTSPTIHLTALTTLLTSLAQLTPRATHMTSLPTHQASLTVTGHLVTLVRTVEVAVTVEARRKSVRACAVAFVRQVGTFCDPVTADRAQVLFSGTGHRARLETRGRCETGAP